MLERLRERQEWKFMGVLPALFAIAMGVLVAAVEHGESLTVPLAVAGEVFVLR